MWANCTGPRTLIPAAVGHWASRFGIWFVSQEQGERAGSEAILSTDILFGGKSGLNFPLSPEIPRLGENVTAEPVLPKSARRIPV